jgi:ribosomal protein S18 acetylase RimI-like enzyme
MNLTEITLRPATPADEPFLLELRRATMNEHLERAGEPCDDNAHRQRVRYRFEDAHIVCCASQKLGLFKFFREPHAWGIVQIQIVPAHQGRGIAARLLRDFLEAADRANVAVTLSVLKGNRAIDLYERLGFQVVNTTASALEMRRAKFTA